MLWLAGNRRSDTLRARSRRRACSAVACGESSLGYTHGRNVAPRPYCCGLRGIVARIHWPKCRGLRPRAVACGESSLGYTRACSRCRACSAVACGESSLGYTRHRKSLLALDAVACGESSLGYTPPKPPTPTQLAVACGESSLGYTLVKTTGTLELAVACGESSLGYTELATDAERAPLWLAGNRRSDTLICVSSPTRSLAVACGESSLGYTRWSVTRYATKSCGQIVVKKEEAGSGLPRVGLRIFHKKMSIFSN